MSIGLRTEQARYRLLKPTRSNAPTEYNLSYKKWPQNGDLSRTGTAQNKRGKLVKPARIWSSCKPQRPQTACGTAAVYSDYSTEETCSCSTDSFLRRFSSEQMITHHVNGNLRAPLMTTPAALHSRPCAPTPGHGIESEMAILIQLETELTKENRPRQMKSSCMHASPKPKRAWLTTKEEEKYQATLQKSISDKLRYLNVHNKDKHNCHPTSFARRTSTKNGQSNKTVVRTKLSHQAPAALHSRPCAPTPGHGIESEMAILIQLETEPTKENRPRQMKSSCMHVSPKPKRAWLTTKEEEKYQATLQKSISDKLRYLNVYNKDKHNCHPTSFARQTSRKNGQSNKTVVRTKLSHQSKHPLVSSPRRDQCPIPSGRAALSLPNEAKDALPTEFNREHYFPEDNRVVPPLKLGGKVLPKSPDCNVFKERHLGDGIGVESLQKNHTGATVDEFQRLKRKFRAVLGSNPKGERVTRKPYVSINSDLSSVTAERSLSKQDLDKYRIAAFKACQAVGGALYKDTWTTSYASQYCRKWSGDAYKSLQSTKTSQSNDEHEDFNQEFAVKEQFISKDFSTEESSQMSSVDEDEANENEEEKDPTEDESTTNSFVDGAPVSKTVKFSKPENKTNTDVPEVSPGYAKKVLKDAHEIEEREYKSTFREDGKKKMKFDTTFLQTYKDPECRKPEETVWVNGAIVSLGSGHWNMLWDHYDGWEPDGDVINNVQNMKPRKVERRKYKVYEQGEPCPAKSRINKDTVMGRYGGDGGTRKTHVNYVTEYMTKFVHMPMPRKKVLI